MDMRFIITVKGKKREIGGIYLMFNTCAYGGRRIIVVARSRNHV